jgi:thioredoxin 1
MPVFDTPITTDDNSIERILGQRLPVLVYFYDSAHRTLDEAVNSIAKAHAGDLLVVRIDAAANPQAYARFERPTLPALVAVKEGRAVSKARAASAADVEAHTQFLLGKGPQPVEQTTAAPSTGNKPVQVLDSTFAAEVLQSSVPVLVDFWAPWCGPCRMVAPSLENIAQQYAGKVKVAKLNVDDNPQMARQYSATSIPLLLLFKEGRVVGKLVGAHPQPNIEQLVRQAL